MQWHRADAVEPQSYRELAASCTAALHTIGILLEAQYKGADASLRGLLDGLLRGWGLQQRNPLSEDALTYERMNRDAGA